MAEKISAEKKGNSAKAPKTVGVAHAHTATHHANAQSYPIRGNIFEGKVVSAKANKTVTVERELVTYMAKYERYKKVRQRVKAHNPENINAKEGDLVRIGETRRISKTKAFVVMEVLTHASQ